MKRYDPSTEIMSTICALDTGDKVRAYFASGKSAVYSAYMIDLLKTDAAVVDITNESTGELLYSAVYPV